MNRESKRLFKTTYDSINARFKALFPKMFRGGAAELRLTNPDDMLETGIEILAQPPGKKLGNIELMSGGEKALTAVSLIFAIFQHKPSPFCILDEVDAPLDEANVTRYNEAIRSMTDNSQFILITHIKRTMQSVDVLYGVTMQEPGVSKLVSVRVNESAKRSNDRRRRPWRSAVRAAADKRRGWTRSRRRPRGSDTSAGRARSWRASRHISSIIRGSKRRTGRRSERRLASRGVSSQG
jgi:hypothetical protein